MEGEIGITAKVLDSPLFENHVEIINLKFWITAF